MLSSGGLIGELRLSAQYGLMIRYQAESATCFFFQMRVFPCFRRSGGSATDRQVVYSCSLGFPVRAGIGTVKPS